MSEEPAQWEVPRVIAIVAGCKKLEMQRPLATSPQKAEIVHSRDILRFQSLNRVP